MSSNLCLMLFLDSLMTASTALPDFASSVPALLKRLDASLDRWLPAADTDPHRLHQAIRYACRGGKRLRALLVYASGEALGVPLEKLDAPACAVELIHAYSLVHDDLPGMDNDDLRRGQPTVHIAYDVATAILVGDALQTLAFNLLTDPANALDARQQVAMIASLAHASGPLGMVGGQAVDMESEGASLSLEQLESLHARKTGALIRVSCELAAIAGAASTPVAQALARYGSCLGLAFQIQDDVLDQTADTATLGKTAGKDQAQQKSTFPSLLGLDTARQRASDLFDQAREIAIEISGQPAPLLWLADFIQKRDH
ncbi:geranylgeranyl pyrophosphate synthase [Frateuria aurantia DSM 6220]|uniref:Geranylgeranyl pyrophosphate synthase n=2 Tax=Frateuria aurantia TaxID=81475 RepID=H8L1C8_FRAAD|nr:geranylgeranyl pyrophosphate synthase [Frateuria aurantia DSM 6220]